MCVHEHHILIEESKLFIFYSFIYFRVNSFVLKMELKSPLGRALAFFAYCENQQNDMKLVIQKKNKKKSDD